MTHAEILDSLSDTLIRDEHILNARERELIACLLQRAGMPGNSGVNETIAQVVGEIVAQRAYGLLGESIVRCLTERSPLLPQDTRHHGSGARGSSAHSGLDSLPQPRTRFQSGPGPILPPGPRPPSPIPPGPKAPPPSSKQTQAMGIAVLDEPEVLTAECVILDEFLAPSELDALLRYALGQEAAFCLSEVISPGLATGVVDHEHRRSRVLMDLGKHEEVILNRIRSCWPSILPKLHCTPFVASRAEIQITASNDGDFFRCHTDNGSGEVAQREITFVYFFHREPKKFQGGELRIYDSRMENGEFVPTLNYRTIVPQQNQLVLFASSLSHEITAVECPSRAFADSRFTVNGWFHR